MMIIAMVGHPCAIKVGFVFSLQSLLNSKIVLFCRGELKWHGRIEALDIVIFQYAAEKSVLYVDFSFLKLTGGNIFSGQPLAADP